MRVGIVGTGFMGATHAAGWANTPVTIAGFVTKELLSGERLAAEYGGRIYDDLATMLEDVDVVDVCAPTHRHYEIVLTAASAGLDILCEKPLARTISQAQEMIAACQEAGVKLMVAHVVRFFPGCFRRHRPAGRRTLAPGQLPAQESERQLVPGPGKIRRGNVGPDDP